MPGEDRKLKLLYLARYLMENTDAEHGVTVEMLCEHLSEHGITAERKAIYSDIDALRRFGMDIELVREGRFQYRLMSRPFQLPELKLLVDAVESSRFITRKKSLELIDKLSTLASRHEAQQLRRSVYVDERVKTMNESIYYTVDAVHTAVADDRLLRFRYFDYSREKRRVLRRQGGYYTVAPLALSYSDGNYYLLAYAPEHDAVRTYRVDRMQDVDVTDERRALPPRYQRFDPAYHTARMFDMFGGERRGVTLIFDNDLATVVVDRFGTEPTFVPHGDDRFTVTVEVAVSPNFFGWLASFAGRAGILSPADVREQYRAALRRAAGDDETILQK